MSAGTTSGIVGRAAELGRLDAFLDARPFFRRALIIEGDGGVGKTTLFREALHRAAGHGYTVVDCQPAEREVKLSYQALSDLFEPVFQAAMHDLPVPQQRALELALFGGASPGSSIDQRTVYMGTLSVLRRLSREAPLIVAADDLQWLDGPSERALGFAIRRLRDEDVAVIGTRRTDLPADPRSALAEALREVDAERVLVGPLSLGAIQRLVAERLGLHLPRTVLRRIHQTSAGNPFFALEAADAVAALDHIPGPSDSLPVPDDITTLLRARIDKLPARSRDALLVVALAAKPTQGLLEEAIGVSWMTEVDRARRAGILMTMGETIAFSHPFFASVVHASATPSSRRAAHAKLAAAVHDEEARVRHLAMAATAPDEDVAASLEAAAARTHARGAPDAAEELVELAGRLTPPERRDDLRRRAAAAAQYSFAAGDTDRSLHAFETLIASMPAGPERADLLHRVARIHYHRQSVPAAIEAAQQALAEAGDNPALVLAIERELLFPLNVTGDLHGSREHAMRVVELSKQLDDPVGVAHGLAVAALARFMLGGGVDREAIRTVFGVEDEAGGPAMADARGVVSHILAWTDDLEQAREIMDGLRRRVIDEGDEGALPNILFRAAYIEVPWGDWSLAARLAEEGQDVCRRTGQNTFLNGVLSVLAVLHGLRGEMDVARATAEQGIAVALASGAMLGVMFNTAALGFIASSCGDAAGTDAYLGPMLEGMRAAGIDEPAVMWWLPDEIEALVALGEMERAASVVKWFEDRARVGHSSRSLAGAARCRGLLYASQGDVSGATRAFDEALELHDRRPGNYELARTLLAKGRSERRVRKWGPAHDSLQHALELFKELGAVPWAEQVDGELKRIGGRPATPLELTETELRVAELVAAGMSNKEVADALFMSARTVQSNLARVFRKLGIHSRGELAARIAPPRP